MGERSGAVVEQRTKRFAPPLVAAGQRPELYEQRRAGRIGAAHHPRSFDDAKKAFAERQPRFQASDDPGGPLSNLFHDNGPKQLFFAGKVRIKRSLRYAALGRDLLHRGCFVAPAGEHAVRGLKDASLSFFLALLWKCQTASHSRLRGRLHADA